VPVTLSRPKTEGDLFDIGQAPTVTTLRICLSQVNHEGGDVMTH